MKHEVLFNFVLLALTGSIANGQHLTVDMHMGYIHTKMMEHTIYDESLNRLSVGIGSGYHFNNHLAANVELNYEQKGGKGTVYFYNDYGYEVLSYEQTQQLHYITLPVMMQYTFGTRNWRAIIHAGGYYGWLAGAWVNPQTQGSDHKVTNRFNRNDVGLLGGLGIQYQLANNCALTLEWRTSRGITTLLNSEKNRYNFCSGLMLGVHYTMKQAK